MLSKVCKRCSRTEAPGLLDLGVTVVVSAGNSNKDACQSSPARYQGSITVGASDITDLYASFSNYGPCVDIFAPGVGINSSVSSSNVAYNVYSGTSMAAPHVAGRVPSLLFFFQTVVFMSSTDSAPGVAALYVQAHPLAAPSVVADAIACASTKGVVKGERNLPTSRDLLHSIFANCSHDFPLRPVPAVGFPRLDVTYATFNGSFGPGDTIHYLPVNFGRDVANGSTIQVILTVPSNADFDIRLYAYDFSRGGITDTLAASETEATPELFQFVTTDNSNVYVVVVSRYLGEGKYFAEIGVKLAPEILPPPRVVGHTSSLDRLLTSDSNPEATHPLFGATTPQPGQIVQAFLLSIGTFDLTLEGLANDGVTWTILDSCTAPPDVIRFVTFGVSLPQPVRLKATHRSGIHLYTLFWSLVSAIDPSTDTPSPTIAQTSLALESSTPIESSSSQAPSTSASSSTSVGSSTPAQTSSPAGSPPPNGSSPLPLPPIGSSPSSNQPSPSVLVVLSGYLNRTGDEMTFSVMEGQWVPGQTYFDANLESSAESNVDFNLQFRYGTDILQWFTANLSSSKGLNKSITFFSPFSTDAVQFRFVVTSQRGAASFSLNYSIYLNPNAPPILSPIGSVFLEPIASFVAPTHVLASDVLTNAGQSIVFPLMGGAVFLGRVAFNLTLIGPIDADFAIVLYARPDMSAVPIPLQRADGPSATEKLVVRMPFQSVPMSYEVLIISNSGNGSFELHGQVQPVQPSDANPAILDAALTSQGSSLIVPLRNGQNIPGGSLFNARLNGPINSDFDISLEFVVQTDPVSIFTAAIGGTRSSNESLDFLSPFGNYPVSFRLRISSYRGTGSFTLYFAVQTPHDHPAVFLPSPFLQPAVPVLPPATAWVHFDSSIDQDSQVYVQLNLTDAEGPTVGRFVFELELTGTPSLLDFDLGLQARVSGTSEWFTLGASVGISSNETILVRSPFETGLGLHYRAGIAAVDGKGHFRLRYRWERISSAPLQQMFSGNMSAGVEQIFSLLNGFFIPSGSAFGLSITTAPSVLTFDLRLHFNAATEPSTTYTCAIAASPTSNESLTFVSPFFKNYVSFSVSVTSFSGSGPFSVLALISVPDIVERPDPPSITTRPVESPDRPFQDIGSAALHVASSPRVSFDLISNTTFGRVVIEVVTEGPPPPVNFDLYLEAKVLGTSDWFVLDLAKTSNASEHILLRSPFLNLPLTFRVVVVASAGHGDVVVRARWQQLVDVPIFVTPPPVTPPSWVTAPPVGSTALVETTPSIGSTPPSTTTSPTLSSTPTGSFPHVPGTTPPSSLLNPNGYQLFRGSLNGPFDSFLQPFGPLPGNSVVYAALEGPSEERVDFDLFLEEMSIAGWIERARSSGAHTFESLRWSVPANATIGPLRFRVFCFVGAGRFDLAVRIDLPIQSGAPVPLIQHFEGDFDAVQRANSFVIAHGDRISANHVILVEMSGPPRSDFDIYLEAQSQQLGVWTVVRSSTSDGSNESIAYRTIAEAVLYQVRIVAFRSGGHFALAVTVIAPMKTAQARRLLQSPSEGYDKEIVFENVLQTERAVTLPQAAPSTWHAFEVKGAGGMMIDGVMETFDEGVWHQTGLLQEGRIQFREGNRKNLRRLVLNNHSGQSVRIKVLKVSTN